MVTGFSTPAGGKDPARAEGGEPSELFRISSEGRRNVFFAVSPDSKTLAYCESIAPRIGERGTYELVLADLSTGKELRRAPVGPTMGGAFSPDGKLLAIGSWRTKAVVWDVERWEHKLDLAMPYDHGSAVPIAFSPDGKSIFGTQSSALPPRGDGLRDAWREPILWDATTGKYRLLEDKEEKLKNREKKAPADPPPLYCSRDWAKAAWFADDGSPFVFALYPGGGTTDGTAVWDTDQRRLVQFPGGWNLRSARTTPGGRLLVLPRYDPPPVTPVLDTESDGTIALVVTPTREWFGLIPQAPRLEKLLVRLKDLENSSYPPRIALSPDGRKLVAVGIRLADSRKKGPPTTLIAWDLTPLHAVAARHVPPFPAKERERLWERLAEEHPGPDDPRYAKSDVMPHGLAHQAMAWLVAHPKEAVPFLRDKLGPPPDLKPVPGLIEALNSDTPATREQAAAKLRRLGHAARPLLEEALKKKPPLHQQREIEGLLDKLRDTAASHEFRLLRIIDVLEHISTPEARDLLQAFADGQYDPAFADEAKKALKRAAAKP